AKLRRRPTNRQPGVRYAERSDMLKARMIAFLLAAAICLAAHNNGALAETRPCHSMQYERNGYVCEVDLRKHMVRLYWKRSTGPLCVSFRPATSAGRRGGQAALRHQRRHVRSRPQACWTLCGTGTGARACKHQVRLRQFSPEAERGLLYIRR